MRKETLPKIVTRLLTAALTAVAGGATVAFTKNGEYLLAVVCAALAVIFGVFLVHDLRKLNTKG